MATQTGATLTSHTDLITSVSFSTHHRLATTSLDHTIRVTQQDPQTSQWDYNPKEWKAHDAPVLKAAWAHAQFGVILASGGIDGLIKIWSPAAQELKSASTNANAVSGAGKKWLERAILTDCKGTVRDLQFAPHAFGLKLASISSDSRLRVWECLDPINLTEWSLVEDIDLNLLPTTPSSSTSTATNLPFSAGNQTGFDPSTNSNSAHSASPMKIGAGTSYSTSAGVSGAGVGSIPSSTGSGFSLEGRKSGTVESDGAWSLSWCKEHWWGERLAVSAGNSGIIRLFYLPDHRPWQNYLNLFPPRTSNPSAFISPTTSLAWAPASGRSYQLLASGARDGRARVWKLRPPSLDAEEETTPQSNEWSAELDAELEDNKTARGGSVGSVKVEWNQTGTVLSTSGDDGKVRLWKASYAGQWRTIAVLSTEDGEDSQGMQLDK